MRKAARFHVGILGAPSASQPSPFFVLETDRTGNHMMLLKMVEPKMNGKA